jgi:hypothetical protein
MSKLKVTVVAVIAVCAFATAAAAAQAHQYLVEEKGVTGPVELATGARTGGPYVLTGTPFGVATKISCSTVSVGSGSTIGTGGSSTSVLEFTGCEVAKPAKCVVKEPIVTSVNDVLIGPVGAPEDEFVPPEGKPFTEITLQNKGSETCSLNGKPFKVEGEQVCKLPEATSSKKAHALECKTAGSKLTAGGKTATFEGTATNIEVKSGANWSAE